MTRRIAPRALGLLFLVVVPVLAVAAVRCGSTDSVPDLATALRGALAALHLGPPLAAPDVQAIVALRLWRALTAAGVGAALGYSGALIQGLFRNDLASPGILGISSGASLGAACAVLLFGGYGPNLAVRASAGLPNLVAIPLFAFVGALGTGALVWILATSKGRVSIPALLLIGIAVNTFIGGLLQLVQSLVIGDWEVSRSILAWTFGTLDGRLAWHAATVWIALALTLLVVPFVAWELDLMQAGLEDAAALGVHTARVRWLALTAASLAAAASVAVAGEIAFVGLVVPHVVRALSGPSHKSLLVLSALAGASFLLGADLAQTIFLRGVPLQPGVVMSLVGGPFFVLLLWRRRREIGVW
ncbi:MAG TPA: iron ABC transporter permease [Planctomycetota bacterium]|nr:iron ABC transporter permease [Planctomycetota bacterium]